MRVTIPKIEGAILTSVTFTSQATIKRLVCESSRDTLDIVGEFDASAEVVINRIVEWKPEGGVQ